MFVQARGGKERPAVQPAEVPDDASGGDRRPNGCRTTPIGLRAWDGSLRRFRLDELPQLVNVLRGEMNLVGPRPHPTCNQEIFEEHIAYYSLRSTVRPWSDRLGAGSVRLRQQHRGRNREDAVRPVLHQEPVARPRRQNPSGDRRNHPARPRGRAESDLTRPDRPAESTVPADPPLPRVPVNLDLLRGDP